VPGIACAIYVKRYPIVVEQARRLVHTHQFNNEPFRVLMASLSSGLRPTDAFITSTLQKHLFREIKLSDVAVKSRDSLRWNTSGKRWGLASGGAGVMDDEHEDGEPDEPPGEDKGTIPNVPTKDNPILVTMYGQVCLAARSYQSALCTSLAASRFHDHGLSGLHSLPLACV